MNIVERFWEWIDARGIVRRIVLGFTLYATMYGMTSAWNFAYASKFDGVGTAAIIAAVLAPLAYLQKAVFDAYLTSRTVDK